MHYSRANATLKPKLHIYCYYNNTINYTMPILSLFTLGQARPVLLCDMCTHVECSAQNFSKSKFTPKIQHLPTIFTIDLALGIYQIVILVDGNNNDIKKKNLKKLYYIYSRVR